MKNQDFRIIVRTKLSNYSYGGVPYYKVLWKKYSKAVMLNKEFSTKKEAVEYLQAKGWKLDIGSTRRLVNHNRNYEACVVPAVEIKCGNDIICRSPLNRDTQAQDFYHTLYITSQSKRGGN